MIKAAKTYVKYVDATSKWVGKVVMYLIFVMMGILLYDTITRTVFNKPNVWAVELTQFFMAPYYLLGGASTLILGGHVRMDVFYDKWSPKKKALSDVITFAIILFYMTVLLIGGIQGIQYAARYGQVTYSSWAPKVLPVKIFMVAGIVLMYLQVISELIKDIATLRGEDLRAEQPKEEGTK
ncbi:MAG: TRAP transporter small permease subunit [Rectinemataceae bacterium]|nr:TRAP transporter small permease subunit [Rectinemataceae bacterium]